MLLISINTGVGAERADLHRNAIDAAVAAGVRHVVYTSFVDVDNDDSPLAGDHVRTEQMIRDSGLAWTMLRNSLYMNGVVARAAPDGYTMLLGNTGPMTINPVLRPDLPYDPRKNFAPVTWLTSAQMVLVVHPSLPVRSLKDLVALAPAHPGSLNLGSAGGCGNAAFIYHTHGSGIRRTRPDPVQAARLYARACNLGRPSSCFVLGEMVHDGTEIARDHARAARVFEAACNRDYAPACGRLGQQYRWGKGVRLDWLRSYQLFERACALGHRQSCADILDVRALLGGQ